MSTTGDDDGGLDECLISSGLSPEPRLHESQLIEARGRGRGAGQPAKNGMSTRRGRGRGTMGRGDTFRVLTGMYLKGDDL